MVFMNNILLEEWKYTDTDSASAVVVPDGCRDIILSTDTQGRSSCIITSLDLRAYNAKITAGVQLHGFRLQPGVNIDEASVMEFFNESHSFEAIDKPCIENFCSLKSSVSEALEGIRSDLESIDAVSKNLGVSVRTLQRHIKSETGISPSFWRSLVRARRCARTLVDQPSLTDAALQSGYSDHAHMARELQRWFNCTPSELKKGYLQAEVSLSGYD